MRSTLLSSSKLAELNWDSPISGLYKSKKIPKSVIKLNDANINNLSDLMWLFPNTIVYPPKVDNFNTAIEDQFFTGIGRVIKFQARPQFYNKNRFKKGPMLQNLTILVSDHHSKNTIELKWFNCYFSFIQKIKEYDYISFTGTISYYKNSPQIISPEMIEIKPEQLNELNDHSQFNAIVSYPTKNSVKSTHLSKIINKIPESLWQKIKEPLPLAIIKQNKFPLKNEAIKLLHGKGAKHSTSKDIAAAKSRLIFEEFFTAQSQFLQDKKSHQRLKTIPYKISPPNIKKLLSHFPFTFTPDQKISLQSIITDLKKPYAMHRLIQGDVGCGKTVIAFVAINLSINNKFQSVFLCPSEALARQHYRSYQNFFPQQNTHLLLGATSKKEKIKLREEIENGKANFVIGTHALLQESIKFKNLRLIIIDEQHKFGVNQRDLLFKKNPLAHLISMTATPIPRSLQLSTFGNFDISTIKSMPAARKGHKTKIIGPKLFEKFLTFLNTRLSLAEQAFIVVPAIDESEILDLKNINQTMERFQNYFPQKTIAALHGKLPTADKESILNKFILGQIDILICTSVIEVGIDIHNATVMAILNPDRFGLSSLHQLRGRIGRGAKPGFCFLIHEDNLSSLASSRLKIIEQENDGLTIAENDLAMRGEGNIFGKIQAGSGQSFVLADPLLHAESLYQARIAAKSFYNANDDIIYT